MHSVAEFLASRYSLIRRTRVRLQGLHKPRDTHEAKSHVFLIFLAPSVVCGLWSDQSILLWLPFFFHVLCLSAQKVQIFLWHSCIVLKKLKIKASINGLLALTYILLGPYDSTLEKATTLFFHIKKDIMSDQSAPLVNSYYIQCLKIDAASCDSLSPCT